MGVDFHLLDKDELIKLNHSLENQLRERKKELEFLTKMSDIIDDNAQIQKILKLLVNLLPSAFQFPEETSARIKFESEEYVSNYFHESQVKLSNTFEVSANLFNDQKPDSIKIGTLEVYDLKNQKDRFLAEELNLLKIICERISKVITRIILQEELNNTIVKERELEKRIQQQAKDILENSTPVIQVFKNVIIAPIIGNLDSTRAQDRKSVV